MTGPLKNARHERFAQELAKGKAQDKAYADAGYKPDRGAASRLSSNVNVIARLQELKERTAEKTVVTAASITDRLLAIAKKGEEKDDASMLQVARASLMDAAKLNGLVVDRSKFAFDFTNLSDEELDVLERILGKTANA